MQKQQIGIDVLPEFRSRGVATYLVTLLKNKILEEGILIEEKPNEYSLCCIYELYYYGLKLITKQEILSGLL